MYLSMIHLENQQLSILSIRVSFICCVWNIDDRFLFSPVASLKTIFVDKDENILTLLKLVQEVPTLKRIVLTKKLTNEKENEIRNKAKEAGIEIMLYNQLRVR